MGVIGPFNSSVALAEIPKASAAHLAVISPSNTNPCLTAVVAVCSDPTININTASLYQGPHTYFRVIASDVSQGDILGYIAAKTLNAKKAYVIDDQEAYGRGLALDNNIRDPDERRPEQGGGPDLLRGYNRQRLRAGSQGHGVRLADHPPPRW